MGISIFFALKGLVLGGGSKPMDAHRVRTASAADLIGMGIYWCWVCFLVAQFPSTWQRVCFVLVSHWTVGILHVQLLLSHLATDTFTAEEEAEIGFFRFQLATSRNIDCHSALDHWFHGGLEYQIELPLFPQPPRHSLGKVKPMVMELCAKHGIHYESTGFMDALSHCVADFRRLATAVVSLEQ